MHCDAVGLIKELVKAGVTTVTLTVSVNNPLPIWQALKKVDVVEGGSQSSLRPEGCSSQ